MPLRFEPMAGQTDGPVQYRARAGGYQVRVSSNGAQILCKETVGEAGRDSVLTIELGGANPAASLAGTAELRSKVSYLVGDNPAQWRRNLSTFAKVRAAQVYPGIDLVYYGNEQQLEFDFVVAPGADPGQIRLAIGGANGIEVDEQGDLVIHLGTRRLVQRQPQVYQEQDGVRKPIQGRYVLEPDGCRVGFSVATYDQTKPLVIDPVIVYSTYLGGLLEDSARGIAVDGAGNMYVVGTTTSADFPVVGGPPGLPRGATNAFVTKISAAGDQIIYSTYLGGSGVNKGYGIAVDTNGNAVVMGSTTATNFPTVNALQSTNAGGTDIFVCKLDPSGSSLLFSTYLGGSGDEPYAQSLGPFLYFPDTSGNPLALGPDGNIYVTGQTTSTNFPTANPLQPYLGNSGSAGSRAFITKITPGGERLIYSTYFGKGSTGGQGIAVDSLGNAYIAGSTLEDGLGTTNAVFPNFSQGLSPGAFVAKVNSAGTALVYCTYLAGKQFPRFGGGDFGLGIATDREGNAYVTGSTTSADFPAVNAAQPQFGGGTAVGGSPPPSDAFVTKINPSGTALVYSTFLGGYANTYYSDDGGDAACAIATDGEGNAYVTGFFGSSSFPILNSIPNPPTFPIGPGQARGAFVAKYDPQGRRFYSSVLSLRAVGQAITVDQAGTVYVAGAISDSSLPAIGAIQTGNAGGTDSFVVKIAEQLGPSIHLVSPTNGTQFELGQAIPIELSATAAVNPLYQVELYAGSGLLWATASGSSSFAWNGAPPGRFVLTAVARDARGVSSTNAVSVLVNGTNGSPGFSTYRATPIDVGPGNLVVAPYGLNDLGEVVGTRVENDRYGSYYGFAWNEGRQTSIAYPSGIGLWSGFSAVNNAGTLVGLGAINGGILPALVFSLFTSSGTNGAVLPGSFNQFADVPFIGVPKINERGTICASSYLQSGGDGVVTRSSAVWRGSDPPIPISLGNTTVVSGLNNHDQVVGYYIDTENIFYPNDFHSLHPFVWENGVATELNRRLATNSAPGSWLLSAAADINDAGQIIGSGTYFDAGPDANGQARGYLLDGSSVTDLGPFIAIAINNHGQIAGMSGADPELRDPIYWMSYIYDFQNYATNSHASLWQQGAWVDLHLLVPYGQMPSVLIAAVALNDNGQILCRTATGGYLLTPENAESTTNSVAAARLLNATVAQGTFRLQVQMPNPGAYIIQTSGDLKNWTSVYTNSSPGGATLFTDPNPPGGSDRFYRAVLQQ